MMNEEQENSVAEEEEEVLWNGVVGGTHDPMVDRIMGSQKENIGNTTGRSCGLEKVGHVNSYIKERICPRGDSGMSCMRSNERSPEHLQNHFHISDSLAYQYSAAEL